MEEYEVDATTRRELLRGRACATSSHTRSVAALFLTGGMTRCIDRLCAFYGNVAILSTLTGGFSCSILISPPDEMAESGSVLKDVAGLCGILGFVLLMAAAVDCILIDNTLKMMATPTAFLSFLDQHQTLLGLPQKLFIIGIVFVMSQMMLVMSFLFSHQLVALASAGVATVGGALIRRHLKLASFIATAALAVKA